MTADPQIELARAEDFEVEREWLVTTGNSLHQWREDMYFQAPQHVRWTAYDFPSALQRMVLYDSTTQIVKVSVGRSIEALHYHIDVESQRRPNSCGNEALTHIMMHPLFKPVRSVLESAIEQASGGEGTARGYKAWLLQAVWYRTPILAQRVVEGHPDALAMQRCMTILVTTVIEAEIRHSRIMAQIEGPNGLINRRYKGVPTDDFESDVVTEEESDEEAENGDESDFDSESDITEAAVEELAELAVSPGDVTAMVAA
nr:hypothetical protein B0A51_11948 [Rachicladosporium sp. CCFEE 5018]